MKKLSALLIIVSLITLLLTPVYGQGEKEPRSSDNPFLHQDAEWANRLKSQVAASDRKPDEVIGMKHDNYRQQALQIAGDQSDDRASQQIYLVKYKDTASLQSIHETLDGLTWRLIGPSDNRLIRLETADIGLYQQTAGQIIEYVEADHYIHLNASQMSLNTAGQDDVAIQTAVDNSLNTLAVTVDDPYYSDQWALQSLNAPEAWTYTIGNPASNGDIIYVAVIDSGIDVYHPDLFVSDIRNGWDYLRGTYVEWDTNGHGTMVSGIISASTNNGQGIAGMCWSIAIVPLLVAGSDGKSSAANMIEAIYDSAYLGMHVINISMGSSEYSLALNDAVQFAASQGCIIVASSGNDGNSTLNYPASCDQVISVGSVNSSHARSSFSNYNDSVTVVAPGEGILTTHDNYYSPYEEYVIASGTSFSAPYVSAIAALAVTMNPDLNYQQFHDLILESSVDLGTQGYDPYYGHGLINAASLLTELAVDLQAAHIRYRSHIQTYGWEIDWRADGDMSGTTGEAKRLEAIVIELDGVAGGVEYRTHVQSYGWLDFVSDGAMSGTSGEAKRLEAIEIRLTGDAALDYDIYYRVHAQSFGWLNWAKNGEPSGTAGFAFRLEGIEILLLDRGKPAPGPTGAAFYDHQQSKISYRSHIQTYGWEQIWKFNGQLSGTTGEAKRLEAMAIILNDNVPGGVEYRTHVQSYGWMGWVSDGAMSGTSGEAKRLEAIEIRLTGQAARVYDIYYRVHAQKYGWLDWAKNGTPAGTAGFAYRLEAIEIRLVPRNGRAPGATLRPFVQK